MRLEIKLKRRVSVIGILLLSLVMFSSHAFTKNALNSRVVPEVINTESVIPSKYSIKVLDKNNEPVSNVVVEFQLLEPESHSIDKVAIMDQVQEQFIPHILLIEKGTLVSFPNSDNIKHHIYSFSQAKSFEQSLYKGKQAAPIKFDEPGVVDLGCNIHDWMLAYIYVADSHFFSKTNAAGYALVTIPSAIRSVTVWHPRMREKTKRLKIIPEQNQSEIVFTLENEMLEDTEGYETISIETYP